MKDWISCIRKKCIWRADRHLNIASLPPNTVQSFVRSDRAMPGADPWVPHTSIHTENGHRERQGRAKWNHKFGPDQQLPDDAPHPYYTSLSQDLPDSVLRADPSSTRHTSCRCVHVSHALPQHATVSRCHSVQSVCLCQWCMDHQGLTFHCCCSFP